MVLDSNVDPRDVWYRLNLNQDIAFEQVIQLWFGWIARHHSVYHLGRTAYAVQKMFYRQKAHLQRKPARGIVGPDEWVDAFTFAAYAQFLWPDLAKVFAGWVHDRHGRALVRAYRNYDTPGDDNLFAVYNAVECTDARWPHSWAKWNRDNSRITQFAPFFTWANAWFNASCRVWPARAGTPVRVAGHDVAALLIDETLDAATPFQGSLEVRSRFRRSSLIAVRGGTTHASTPFLSSDCTNDLIARYLKRGQLPPRRSGRRADISCQPLPEPQAGNAPNTVSRPFERLLVSMHRWGP
ncbi:MAG: alpha/beta hydrolase [Propionibacteriales bacterium]|nr:alpha/beta hydrolase [Propionibacteriales bacterium]